MLTITMELPCCCRCHWICCSSEKDVGIIQSNHHYNLPVPVWSIAVSAVFPWIRIGWLEQHFLLCRGYGSPAGIGCIVFLRGIPVLGNFNCPTWNDEGKYFLSSYPCSFCSWSGSFGSGRYYNCYNYRYCRCNCRCDYCSEELILLQ